MSVQTRLLPEPPGRYAQVAVPVPVDGTFTYRLPEAFEARVQPGMRVRVRFGGRQVVGVVTGIADALPSGIDAGKVREVQDCLDRKQLLPPPMVRLAERVAQEVLVGIGEALQLLLPGGRDPAAGRRVRRAQAADLGALLNLSPGERRLLSAAAAAGENRWVRLSDLLRRARSPAPHAGTFGLVAAGLLELRDEWSGEGPGLTVAVLTPPEGQDRETALAATARAPAQRRALEHLWEAREPVPVGELVRQAGVSAQTLRQLERKGLVERTHRAPARAPDWTLGADGAGSFVLTPDQARALAAIESSLLKPAPKPLLIHGVTGSGKTEIYLRAAAHALAQGKSALLLVPEIGLTPQLQQRAQAVLGDRVAVLHSGLSASERQRAWWRVRRGEAPVVVGPRSAVFAPLQELGLVVIDEEQDSAYKQQERPRYNGRDVALWRAQIEGALAVLGSATPSVETYAHSVSGTYQRTVLPRRVASRALPRVDLVDMRREWRESGRSLLSRDLEARIEDRLQLGEQVLLLLNRRGFASALVCRACGARAECPECAVTLTLHHHQRSLRCHYCDHRQTVLSCCPQCGADSLHELGFGTERLQESLRKRFPRARIERFDADQTQRRGAHARILSAFGERRIDVLVGTQMLAKGHDFPGVTLVGVIGADAGLGMPDFRAAERTFQLLTQMAGRAGRGEIAGEVVLQAQQPEHYAIEAAMRHDYGAFFDQEIAYRRRLGYPPFSEIAICVARGKLAPVVKEEADRLAAALRRGAGSTVTVLGPASPPIGRLRGKYRLQVLLKAPDRCTLTTHLRQALAELERQRRMPRDLVIDIDPRNFM